MILELEKQVCSLESAKRLKELGWPQESLFYWCEPWPRDTDQTPHVNTWHYATESNVRFKYSAYTCSELGELMPNWAATFKSTYPEGIRWTAEDGQSPEHKHIGNTETEARAKMLIHLTENGLVKTKE